MLMITGSLQLNMGGCFSHNSFAPGPVLHQSVTTDFYHQKPNPEKNKNSGKFPHEFGWRLD